MLNSYAVSLKCGNGEARVVPVPCSQPANYLQSLQAVVEKECQVPIFRQRLIIENGTRQLLRSDQLQSALEAALKSGQVLGVQVVSKVDMFPECDLHAPWEKVVFCFTCKKFLCHKCVLTHINNTNAGTGHHLLADLEDYAQFTATVQGPLRQLETNQESALNSAQATSATIFSEFSTNFGRWLDLKAKYFDASFQSTSEALRQQRRCNLRTTVEAAEYFVEWRAKRSAMPPNPFQSNARTYWEVQGAVSQLQVAVPPLDADNFRQCPSHPNQLETFLCVECFKFMCPRCFALHVNPTIAHQGVDMEDPAHFNSKMQFLFDNIDMEAHPRQQQLRTSLTATETQMNEGFAVLLSSWAKYLSALSTESRIQERSRKREMVSTPTEIIQWVLGS